ncbi:unnamed protein product [Cylicostephanus goldi]|uniref:Uncharacterized protein n=1 Tax=Cylicostephanus goldi TaxID=71465 RepID=A0A3P6R7E3_CYLGO|nr:unnamed protein product [Cylicostephanus goldi]
MVTLREKKADASGQEEKDMNGEIRLRFDPIAVDKLYSELIAKYPTHLPLLLTKMKLLMDKKRSTTEADTMRLIIQQILEQCRVDEVLKYLGARQDHNLDQISLKKNMDERKAAIIDCLLARAHMVVDLYLKMTDDLADVFHKPLAPVFGLSSSKVS